MGVLHRNHTIFTRGFGLSDKSEGRVPDPQTIYSIGSCTKVFTAVALVLLVQQGRIRWDEPIGKYLPTFDTAYNPDVGRNARLADILSHSVGLSPCLYAIMGKNGTILTRHEDVVHSCSRLPCVAPLRSEWQYNNWLYALAARLVDIQGNATWSTCVHEILDLLDLNRTYTRPPTDGNVACAYTVFSDGSYLERPPLSFQEGDAFDGSGCLRSCVRDMLKWCKILIAASECSDSSEEGGCEVVPPVSTEPSENLSKHDLLKAMRFVQQPHIALTSDPLQSYGLGLFSFHLPTTEINSVTNAPDVMKSYVLGAKSAPKAVIGHSGDLVSFTSAFWAFPETQSAVVVLTNASSVDGDPSNIVAQVLIQAMFALAPAIDFVDIAQKANAAARNTWNSAADSWNSARIGATHPKDLSSYVGAYTSTDLRMTLHFSIAPKSSSTESSLQLCINNLPDQIFPLYHYHFDTWSFFPKSRDKCLALGLQLYISNWKTFNFEFDRFAVDRFRGILWNMDIDPRTGPQVFSRVGP